MDLTRGPPPSYVGDMFTIHCPRENAEILLGPRRIERLDNTDHGVVLHWRCYCGHTGSTPYHGGATRVPRSAAA